VATTTELSAATGIAVSAEDDPDLDIPVLGGMQRQGDVLVLPSLGGRPHTGTDGRHPGGARREWRRHTRDLSRRWASVLRHVHPDPGFIAGSAADRSGGLHPPTSVTPSTSTWASRPEATRSAVSGSSPTPSSASLPIDLTELRIPRSPVR